MKSNSSSKATYDVYDIDGTLTRPGHDLWYLTTKALVRDEAAFDNRVKRWKKEVAAGSDVVAASETMMKHAIHMIVSASSSPHSDTAVNSQDILKTAKSIARDLIQQGIVFSEWVDFVRQRIAQGVTPVLATTNYLEGAQAFVRALLEATWITKEEADKFLVSGTIVDWTDGTVVHFNMHTKKALGVMQVTEKDTLSELESAVENVFGDDPLGNDYGLIMLAKHDENNPKSHAWVVSTAKNAKLELSPMMQRMSWLHWRDAEKHRIPVGLMSMFGMNVTSRKRNTAMDRVSNKIMLSTPSPTGFPHIVVVGGGFCGLVVARLLQYNTAFDVTLIDPKPYFEYVGALPKSLLSDKQSRVPLATALPHTSIIQGWAESVSESHVSISLEVGGSHPLSINIAYDHLVLATGSTYPAGIKYSHAASSNKDSASSNGMASRSADLELQRAKVLKAKSILIIGGGLVGVEIATEIKSTHPSKHVVVVDRFPTLFPRIVGAHGMVRRRLHELDIPVILGEEVDRVDPDTKEYVTKSGAHRFSVDHAIWCGGPQPNATLVPSLVQAFPSMGMSAATAADFSSSRYCPVDEFLNLKGSRGKVWCGGDICQSTQSGIGEEATAARAIEQGTIIAHNIAQSLKMKDDEEEEDEEEGGDSAHHEKGQLALYEERCLDGSNSNKAEIPSMIVSLGGKRALVVIDNVPVEGPFRHLKEQVENLFLSQISLGAANCGRLQDPYALLNKVDANRLEQYARRNVEPTLRDLLTHELPHLGGNAMDCFVPRPMTHHRQLPRA